MAVAKPASATAAEAVASGPEAPHAVPERYAVPRRSCPTLATARPGSRPRSLAPANPGSACRRSPTVWLTLATAMSAGRAARTRAAAMETAATASAIIPASRRKQTPLDAWRTRNAGAACARMAGAAQESPEHRPRRAADLALAPPRSTTVLRVPAQGRTAATMARRVATTLAAVAASVATGRAAAPGRFWPCWRALR